MSITFILQIAPCRALLNYMIFLVQHKFLPYLHQGSFQNRALTLYVLKMVSFS